MTKTLKVGDDVIWRNGTDLRGTIQYGPFLSAAVDGEDAYLVRGQDSEPPTSYVVSASSIEKCGLQFAVNDRVIDADWWGTGRIVYGPYSTSGVSMYLVSRDGEDLIQPTRASQLHAVVASIGDRVRVVKGDDAVPRISAMFEGKIGELVEVDPAGPVQYLVQIGSGAHGAPDGRWWCAEVERVEADDSRPAGFEYYGVFYEYGVSYLDKDGNIWTFDGTMNREGIPVAVSENPLMHGCSLVRVVRNYGPLDRLNT
ncbi:phiSA1p31-related protein [Streptomyces sp. NPDC020141]|uniref:phiSA1p31-related protein n=1 Tax=Streptomyces sp. NPDC020141 TaxID=3365065 RepID=UPI0037A263C1